MSYREQSPFLTPSPSAGPSDTPFLRVDTSFTTIEPDTPTKSPSAGRSRALSLAIPSLLSPGGASRDSPAPVSPVQELESRNVNAPVSRLRSQYRQLLRHVLQRLQDRAKPTNIFSAFKQPEASLPGSRSDSASLRGFVSISSSLGDVGGTTYESEEEEAATKPRKSGEDTDETCERLSELREVLLGAELRGLHILSSGTIDEDPTTSRSAGLPFGRRRRSTLGQSDRPSTGSLSKDKPPDDGAMLLAQCVSLLSDLIANDCRFIVSQFRPSRPPNSLQSLCIDVAQCLLVSQKGQGSGPKGAYEVGMAMVPAFESFPAAMRGRLCTFFEGVVRGCLIDLKNALGGDRSAATNVGDPFDDRPVPGQPQISIQVEDAGSDSFADSPAGPGGAKFWSTSTTAQKSIISTYAPDHPMRVYYLASLVSPLLASMLENIDMSNSGEDETFWIRRLFSVMVDLKPDVYLDVLEIVAYHTPRARTAALSVLATFWPKALGHNIVCTPLPVWRPLQDPAMRLLRGMHAPSDHPYAHEFLPWRFPPPPRRMTNTSMTSLTALNAQTSTKLSITPCRACMKPVHDFGLFCPFCNSAVHFTCYDPPEGSTLVEYTSSTDVQRLAVMRFSHVLPARRVDAEEPLLISGHVYRCVNFFTLTLCSICHEPMWGVARQGLMCSGCHSCAHSGCVERQQAHDIPACRARAPTETDYTIDWSVLRRTFITHYRPILFTEQELHNNSHETVSIIFCLFWLQLQLLNNGVAAGSTIINQADPTTRAAKANGVDEFELQYLVRLCDAILQNDRLQQSAVLQDFRRLEGPSPHQHALLFDMSFLYYATSLIKAPKEQATDTDLSGSFLRPEILSPSNTVEGDSHPYEITELAHPRDILSQDFLIQSDFVAQHFLQHLHRLGLLERVDFADDLFEGPMPARQLCMFPLPLAVDLSTNVETLFTAVEACLGEVDLMVNETGFLLLKRCWPNGLASAYAIERLVRTVLQWIMKEETNLVAVARDYVAQKRLVPGVRSALDTQPWPTTSAVKSPAITQGGTMTGGNEYIAFRRALLEKYALPWLLRAHNLDSASYMKTLHEHCLATAAEETENTGLVNALFTSKDFTSPAGKIDVSFADATLRAFLKLCQASVVFTTFDDLFMFWLDEISNHGTDSPMVVRTLPRLFQPELDPARRSTLLGDLSFDQELSISDLIDPWRAVTSVASEGVEGVSRSLRWVLVLAQSGVNIPEMTFRQISGFARDFEAPLDVQVNLVHAIFASVWVRSLGRQDLTTLLEHLVERNEEALVHALRQKTLSSTETVFIRLSLAALLSLYGVEREKIVVCGLVKKSEHEALTSRRRVGGRLFGATEHLEVSENFVSTLLRLSRLGTEIVASHVMNFLGLLLTEAALLSKIEVDLFIEINSEPLCRIVWHSFSWNTPYLHDLRIKCVIRLLAVDTKPLEALLDEVFDVNQPWHSRLDNAGTLFSLILELHNSDSSFSESFGRHRISGLYSHFFKLMWDDDQELVRSAVETMAETLLPSHISFIQTCWDEYMEVCDEADKELFLRYLLRLHPFFPTRPLISIRVIVDALGSDQSIYEDPTSIYDNFIDSAETSATSVGPSLQEMLVTLALNFVAHGVVIQPFDLLKIKVFLARRLGFPKAVLRIAADGTCHVAPGPISLPQQPEQGLACLSACKRVLDASAKVEISPSMLGVNTTPDTAVPCLIGALLVDLVLIALRGTADLASMSHLALRCWLECLVIVILKHDMRSSVLRYLDADLRSAVIRTTEIFLLDVPYDNRQLALTVNQCYLRKFAGEGSTILPRQINAVAELLASLDFNSEDILVAQGKAFLTSAFLRFPNNALFVLLLKNEQVSDDLITALSLTLKDCAKDGMDGRQFALRDVMDKAFHYTSHSEFNYTVSNLNRFVDKVYPGHWPADLITEMGFFLSNTSRHTAEWPSDDFNGDAAILIASTIAERNPAGSRELLVHTELYLRWALMRFDIKTSSLERLMKAAELVGSQPQRGPGPVMNEPYLAVAIVDSLRDAMMNKPRPTLVTVHSMLGTARTISIFGPKLTFCVPDRLAADCLTYMQSFHSVANTSNAMSSGEGSPEMSFSVCLEASIIFLLGLEGQREALIAACGVGAGSAMSSRAAQTLRTWSFLSLAAFSTPSDPSNVGSAQLVTSLAQHTMDFSFTLSTLLQALLAPGVDDNVKQKELTYVHVSVVLWLLLAQSAQNGAEEEMTLWLGIWPSYERLIIKTHGLEGDKISAISQSVSDMFTDLVLFLLRSGSSLALSNAASFTGLLTVLKEASRVEGARKKYTRTLRALSEPPARVSREDLVTEARGFLFTHEKVTNAYVSEDLRNNVIRNPRSGKTA